MSRLIRSSASVSGSGILSRQRRDCKQGDYPIQQVAPLAIQTVMDFLQNKPEPLRLVRFCLFSDADLKVYTKALAEAKPG